MAVRDYAIARPGMRGKAARKIRVRSLQEPETTQHTSEQKLVYTKSYDSSNVSIPIGEIGGTIPGPRF